MKIICDQGGGKGWGGHVPPLLSNFSLRPNCANLDTSDLDATVNSNTRTSTNSKPNGAAAATGSLAIGL